MADWRGTAWGGEDVAGAKDHPLLTRYPDSFITEYTKNYDASEFQVGAKGTPPKQQTVEGDTTTLRYFYESVEKQPSPLQLIRNYQNAVKQIGGSVLYERLPKEGDGGETTLQVTTGGKDVWIKVLPDIFGAPTQSYQLVVTEVASMAQVVSANELLQELNKNGFVALYINFDTGKADLKQDGVATVKEIATLMKSNPTLKLSRRRPHGQRRRRGLEQEAVGGARQERHGGNRRGRCRCRATERCRLRPGKTGGRQSHRSRPRQEPARRAGEEIVTATAESG